MKFHPQTDILLKAFGLLAAPRKPTKPRFRYHDVMDQDGKPIRYAERIERSRYSGEDLRKIRAVKGCGRPPKTVEKSEAVGNE